MNEERDLRSHLNDLWKTTVEQFDEIKDVIIRNSHVARKKIDTVSLKQQRNRLLQELGGAVYQQASEGELSLSAEARRYVQRIKEVMEQIAAEEAALAQVSEPQAPLRDDEPTQENTAVVVDLPVAKDAAEDSASAKTQESSGAQTQEEEQETKKNVAGVDQAVDAADASGDKEASEAPKRRRRPRRRRKKSEDARDESSSDDA